MDITQQDVSTGTYPTILPAHYNSETFKDPGHCLHGSGAFINIGEFYSPTSGSLNSKLEFIPPQSIVEIIQCEILDTFNICMSDLAVACRVSRKTVYNWRKNCKAISCQKNGQDRLFKLSEAAKNWRNSGYPTPGNLLREPAVSGKSLYDLLIANTIDTEAIQFLGARLAMRQVGTSELSKPFD